MVIGPFNSVFESSPGTHSPLQFHFLQQRHHLHQGRGMSYGLVTGRIHNRVLSFPCIQFDKWPGDSVGKAISLKPQEFQQSPS